MRQRAQAARQPPLELAIALCSGYIAYLPAQAAGVSGVLAAVTIGVYMGWYTPELTTAQTRLQGAAVWDITLFVLNAVLFTLVGLQLPGIVDALEGLRSWQDLVAWGAVLTLDRDRDPLRLALLDLVAAATDAPGRRRGQLALERHPRLGRDARRGLARRGARPAADDGRAATRSRTAHSSSS